MEIKKLFFFFVNAYVITEGEHTILFDTGLLLPPEQIAGLCAENGVDPKKIELIVISHGHYDHCMLAAAWKELTGAKVLCHKDAVDYLRTGKKSPLFTYGERAKNYQPLSWMQGMFNVPPTQAVTYQPFIDFMESTAVTEIPTCEPDIVIGDEDFDLHPYGISGKLIHTPGHDDSAIALVTDDRKAFTGDTILDLHTVQCLECVYPEGSYSFNWINSGEDIIKNSVKRIVAEADTYYAGHGGPYTREMIEPLVK